jgi:hypothetical protein
VQAEAVGLGVTRSGWDRVVCLQPGRFVADEVGRLGADASSSAASPSRRNRRAMSASTAASTSATSSVVSRPVR